MIDLRLLDSVEIPRILEIVNQDGVAEALGWPRSAITKETLPTWLMSAGPGNIARSFGVHNGRGLIGCVTLNDMNLIDRKGSSSVAVVDRTVPMPAKVMKDAIAQVIDMAFRQFNLWRLEARVLGSNEPIRRIYALLGITQEGVLRDAIFRDNQFHDLVIYSMLRPEWEARHA